MRWITSAAPRYLFIADAEITDLAADTKLKARTADISIGGCFLETLNPIPQGTEVCVCVYHAGASFNAIGRVAFVAPNMGMGIGFTKVADHDAEVLKKWLTELAV